MSVNIKLVHLPHDCGVVKAPLFALYQAVSESEVTPRLPVYYLQGIRSKLKGFGNEVVERHRNAYEKQLPALLYNFVTGVKSAFNAFDFGLMPPSSREDSKPYLGALCAEGLIGRDISRVVKKDEKLRCSTATSIEEVLAAISIDRIRANVNFESIDSLLIVDDVVASGRTVAAIILRMQEAGLRADANVCIATPLLLGDWPEIGFKQNL